MHDRVQQTIRQRIATGARLLLCAALLSSLGMPSAHADSGDPACAKSKAELDAINKQIAALGGLQPPGQQITKDMTDIVNQLISDMKELKGDAGKLLGPMQNAQKKLDALSKTLSDQKVTVPPALKGLRDSLDTLGKGIQSGIKKTNASSVGAAVADVQKGADALGSAIGKLEQVKSGLDTLQQAETAYDQAANGSASEQIQALKFGFDQLKDKLGAGDVPGLGPFLNAYSTALDGMAKNVASAEQSMKDKIKQADEALKGTDVQFDFNKAYGLTTPREKLAATLQALNDAKAALQKERADAECDKPTPPPDPCKNPNGDPAKLKNLADAMTAKDKNAYDAAQSDYENKFMHLADLSAGAPQDKPSKAELQLSDAAAQINSFKQALAANDATPYGSPAKAVNQANALAASLGVAPIKGATALRDLAPLLDKLAAAQTAKQNQARQQGKADYDKAKAAWQKEFDQALAEARDAGKKRDAAKDAYKKALKDTLEKETAAKQWTKAQCDQFDACYPWLAKAKTSCGPPPAQAKCKQGPGIVGGVNFVTDQMNGCK